MSVANLQLMVGGDASGATAALNSVSSSLSGVEKASANVSKTDYKGVVTGMSQVTTSAYALYLGFDRVQDMTLQVDRANLMVKTSTEAVEKAQNAYATAVQKSGVGSADAKQASDALAIAQDRLKLAQDRSANATETQQQGMASFALSVIPSAITMMAGLSTTMMAATGASSGLAAAQAILNAIMSANPVAIVVLAIAGLVAILIAAYNYCEPFRNAVNNLGGAIRDVLGKAFEYIMIGVKAFTDAIGAVAGFLGGVANSIGNWWADVTGATKTATEAQTTAVEASVEKQTVAFLDLETALRQEAAALTDNNKVLSLGEMYFSNVTSQSKDFKDSIDAAVPKINQYIEASDWEGLTSMVSQMASTYQTSFSNVESALGAAMKTTYDYEGALDDLNKSYEEQTRTVQQEYEKQLADTRSFYDSKKDAANQDLNNTRMAREQNLDGLELNYLEEKVALQNSLSYHEISQKTFDAKMKKLQDGYSSSRQEMSDWYRMTELQDELTTSDALMKINQDESEAIKKIKADEASAIASLDAKREQDIADLGTAIGGKGGLTEAINSLVKALGGVDDVKIDTSAQEKELNGLKTVANNTAGAIGGISDAIKNLPENPDLAPPPGGGSRGSTVPMQSAYDNPVMITATTPALLHRGEVVGSPQAIAAKMGVGRGGGGVVEIHGPLVVIQGSADERTARLAADLVMEKIRRIVS